MSQTTEHERLRTLRFVGGPAHNERMRLHPATYYFVPVPPDDETVHAALQADSPLEFSSQLKVAAYRLEGDYPDEWFYKFDGIQHR